MFVVSVAAAAAQAQTRIGDVVEVQVDAFGQIPAQERLRLQLADDVFADQTVETVEGGGLRLRFADTSELTLGSGASLALDRFVYDPAGGSGGIIALGAGTMRFISGSVGQDSNLTVETPTATIGIRGTDFIVTVQRSGETIVGTLTGLVRVSPRNGGAAADIPPGFIATVNQFTEAVEPLEAPFDAAEVEALADWLTLDDFVADADDRFGEAGGGEADDDLEDPADDAEGEDDTEDESAEDEFDDEEDEDDGGNDGDDDGSDGGGGDE